MKRVWRGGVAEGPCGGRSQKINKHMLQFKKIYNPVLGQEVIISQATKAWKLGMCLCTFVSFLGTRTSKSKKNCGCSKRLDLCNSWWVGDVCWSLPTCKGRVTLQPFMHRISAEFARSFWHEQTSRLISNRSFRVPVTSSEHLRTLKAAPVQVGTSKSRIFDVVQSPHCWRESERTISNLMFW